MGIQIAMRPWSGSRLAIALVFALLAAPLDARETVMTIKAGSVRINDDTQFLDGAARDFDAGGPAIAITIEGRPRPAIGHGFEFARFWHDYAPPRGGDAKSQMFLYTLRRYLNADRPVRPWLGFGIGAGHTSVTDGADVDPEISPAGQFSVGIEARAGEVGFWGELKGILFDVSSNAEYDPSGIGAFAGVSFRF